MSKLTRYEMEDALTLIDGGSYTISDEAWERFVALKGLVSLAQEDASLIGPAVFVACDMALKYVTPSEAIAKALSYRKTN